MPRLTLTDRFVSGVRSASRENFFDTKAKGLTLRVAPSGAKSWAFVYRAHGKPPRWMTIGSYPALGLADARKHALDQRKGIEVDGRDPVTERRAATKKPAVFTFADFAKVYLAFAKRRKKTWTDDKQKIHKYLIPAWGDLALRDITRTRVHELLDTLVAQGMTTGVNRVQAVISRMFTVALDRSVIDAHPAARMIKRSKEQPRDRVLSDDEIRELWAALDKHPGAAADAVRLRLLLGQRGAEVHRMRWADVDLDSGTWEMPASMTKNARPHTVALPRTALEILIRQRSTATQDEVRVFPKLTMASQDYRALALIHGDRYEWKDLRRTMATRLAELGFAEATIGRCLNHAQFTVTAKHYNQHQYLDEIREALEMWDSEIARILENKKPRKKVLRFARS